MPNKYKYPHPSKTKRRKSSPFSYRQKTNLICYTFLDILANLDLIVDSFLYDKACKISERYYKI
jgi:hypothetical protein